MYSLPDTHNTRMPKQAGELNIIKSIKEKLRNNKAIVTRADKGNSIVISYRENYEDKVTEFICKNGVDETNNNITTKFQKELRHTLQKCKIVINTEDKWKFTCLNPQTPSLKGFVKVHKDSMPICPVVNYTQAGQETDEYPKDTHPASEYLQCPELRTTHEGHLRNTVRPGIAASFTGHTRYVFQYTHGRTRKYYLRLMQATKHRRPANTGDYDNYQNRPYTELLWF